MTEKKDIKSMPMETLAAEMEALGVKKIQDSAALRLDACKAVPGL